MIGERRGIRVFVGRRVGLGWLWIVTHRRIQRRKGGIEMGIELVQIMILLGRGLCLRRVKGKLTGEIVVGVRWGRLLMLMLMLVIVGWCRDIEDVMGGLWTVRRVIELGAGTA